MIGTQAQRQEQVNSNKKGRSLLAKVNKYNPTRPSEAVVINPILRCKAPSKRDLHRMEAKERLGKNV